MKHLPVFSVTLLIFSLVACAGGDKDNNGKEDNRNRKVWNENDRKQKKEAELRMKDTTSATQKNFK